MTRNDNADMMRAFPSISPPSLSLSLLFSPLLKELTVLGGQGGGVRGPGL